MRIAGNESFVWEETLASGGTKSLCKFCGQEIMENLNGILVPHLKIGLWNDGVNEGPAHICF